MLESIFGAVIFGFHWKGGETLSSKSREMICHLSVVALVLERGSIETSLVLENIFLGQQGWNSCCHMLKHADDSALHQGVPLCNLSDKQKMCAQSSNSDLKHD